MATNFVPLSSRLIDEGEFIEDLDEELGNLQQTLAKYRRKYGDKALKAKAKLVVEIELQISSVEDQYYSVKTSMKTTEPRKPSSVSLAMEGETQDHKLALFVRASGSDDTDPRQTKFTTRDGRPIDPTTGEPFE